MPEDLDFGMVLGLAHQVFIEELASHLKGRGFQNMRRSDGYVFRTLGNGSLTITGLARALGITSQGAGLMVQDMERRGYLERRPHETDQRARMIQLTPQGIAAMRAAARFHQSFERRLAKRYGEVGVATVRRVLSQLITDSEEGGNEMARRLRPG